MAQEETPAEQYRRMSEVKGSECASKYSAAYERMLQVRDVLKCNGDQKGLSLLEELVRKAHGYVESVVRMELPEIVRFRMDTQEFQETISRLDQRRKLAHNALISQLEIMNRYLFRTYEAGKDIAYGGVYSMPPETLNPLDRSAVGDWAGYLVIGLHEHRKATK